MMAAVVTEPRELSGRYGAQCRGGWIARENGSGKFAIQGAHVAGELRENQVDRPVQLTHPIAELLQNLTFQPHQLAQFLQSSFWQLGDRGPFLSRETRDPKRINGVRFGALQLLFGKAARAQWIDQRHRKTRCHQRGIEIAPVMSGCLHSNQTIGGRAEQLEQATITSRILRKRGRFENHNAALVNYCDRVSLRPDINSYKSHQPQPSSHASRLPEVPEPMLTLLLVHARTPGASRDTVRALEHRSGASISAARIISH